MPRRAFKPYSPGAKVANSEVLAITRLNGMLTRYRVRNLCCGQESVLAHKSLDDRRRRGTTQCALCSIKTNQSQGRSTSLEARQQQEALQSLHQLHLWAQMVWASAYRSTL